MLLIELYSPSKVRQGITVPRPNFGAVFGRYSFTAVFMVTNVYQVVAVRFLEMNFLFQEKKTQYPKEEEVI